MRSAYIAFVLSGCYAGHDIIIEAGPQEVSYSGPTIEVVWDLPWDAEEGWLWYDIDDLCGYGCSGQVDWWPEDRVNSVEVVVYNAPWDGVFAISGWYTDGYGWYSVCSDPPWVGVDGWQIDPVEVHMIVDDYGVLLECTLVYDYYFD